MQKKVNYFIFISSLIFISMNSVLADGITRECVTCGSDSLAIPAALPKFVATMVTLVQILVPIALILFTMIRYFKAVAAGEDKGFSEANRAFIRNIIAAVAVFLVIAIVKFAFGVVERASEESGTTNCVSCFITGNCESGTCPERGELNDSSKSSSSSVKKPTDYTTKKSCKEAGYGWGLVVPEVNKSCHKFSDFKTKDSCEEAGGTWKNNSCSS